jgi:hypothetical protein
MEEERGREGGGLQCNIDHKCNSTSLRYAYADGISSTDDMVLLHHHSSKYIPPLN